MHRLLSRYLFIGAALLFMLAGCKSESQQSQQPEEEAPTQKVAVPAFDRDSAFVFLEKQLSFGPRVPGSMAHQECREWLSARLKSFGATVIEQNFQAQMYTGERFEATNIIGQFNPQAGKRVLLAAHWDTRFTADSRLDNSNAGQAVPGADDGASGVAVLLEVARQLKNNPIEIGVDIVFFDAEDQGESGADNNDSWGLGAQYWARNLHVSGYNPKYGILLDMVGARNAQFGKEYWSMYYARGLVEKVWQLAGNMGYGNYFVQGDGGGVTDDHYFVNTIAGIPMIDIINRQPGSETGFGSHWHTLNDNIDVIDKRTLRAVGQVVLAVVYRENNRTF